MAFVLPFSTCAVALLLALQTASTPAAPPQAPDEETPLELAGRYAWVDPDASLDGDSRTELSFCANWFFDRHENKASIELSRLTLEEPGSPDLAELRLRLQWDISF